MMSDHNEKLSSLLDDYRATDQDKSVLSGLQGDVNQQYTLQRYQMIGDVMRKEIPDQIRTDFLSELKHKIDQEPAYNLKPEPAAKTEKEPSWLWSSLFKPVAGLAVAAGVAVVTVATLQSPSNPQDAGEIIAATDASQARVEQLAQLPVVTNAVRVAGNQSTASTSNGTSWKIKRSEPDMQTKLNTYLINHNEYSHSMQGIIPQARVVGFDGQR